MMAMSTFTLTKKEIQQTRERIANHIHETPILSSKYFNEHSGGNVFFKCENLQKTGSFKIRGASNAVTKALAEDKNTVFATHSSGNHGQALAYAAYNANTKAYIVMPDNAPQVKINAVKEYNAEVVMCAPTLNDRVKMCNKVIERTGALFIPPYDADDIIEGQSSCAAELLDDIKGLDYILAPVGGGGLLSGTVLATKILSPNTTVIGCEPENADDAYRSLISGKLIPQAKPNTIADGLRTSLGKRNFEVLTKNNTEIFTVTEGEIVNALQMVWERMKIVIEPSCAVPVAVYLKNKGLFRNKKIGIILSGGNVDLKVFFDDLKLKINS